MSRFDYEYWDQLIADRPDVLHALLSDLWTVTHGVERRPTLEDLWQLVEPKFSNEPFARAFREVQGDRSIRQIALHAPGITQQRLTDFLNGKRDIVKIHDVKGSMERLEAVAQSLRVHPSYFVEWRRLWIVTAVDEALALQPNLSTVIYKSYGGHRKRPPVRPVIRK